MPALDNIIEAVKTVVDSIRKFFEEIMEMLKGLKEGE